MPIQVNFNSGNPIFSPTTALQKATTEIPPLVDLTDVNKTGLNDNDVLVYNETTGKFVPMDIEVVNDKGKVVHKQPFQRSPWEDGTPRDFTYTWMLYYTEDYGDDIPPGEYQIQICHIYSRNVDMILDITI